MRLEQLLPQPHLYRKYSTLNHPAHTGKSFREIEAYLISVKETFEPEELDKFIKTYSEYDFKTEEEYYQTLFQIDEKTYVNGLNKIKNYPYVAALVYISRYVHQQPTTGIVFGDPANWDIIASISLSNQNQDYKVGTYMNPELVYSAKNFITFWHNQSRVPLIVNSKGEWLIDETYRLQYGQLDPDLTVSNHTDRNVGESLTRMDWHTIKNLTEVALKWCTIENKILTYEDYVDLIKTHTKNIEPAAMYSLVKGGVTEGYSEYSTLPTGLINIIYN